MKSYEISLLFSVLMPMYGYAIEWASLPSKIRNLTVSAKDDLHYRLFLKPKDETWCWQPPKVVVDAPQYKEFLQGMNVAYKGKWFKFTKKEEEEIIRIPGGFCPKHWERRLMGYQFAVLHKLLLNYWWKWPRGMLNVKIKSNYKEQTDETYMQKVSSAIRSAIASLIQEFVKKGTIKKEPKKRTFWEKLNDRFGVTFTPTEEWVNYI